MARVSYTLRFDSRAFTINQERRLHYHARADLVELWQQAFKILALKQKIPPLTDATITVQPYLKGKRKMDPTAPTPSEKAATDGLVKAGVLEDDNSPFLRSVTFMAPIIESPTDEFVLTIEGEVRPRG